MDAALKLSWLDKLIKFIEQYGLTSVTGAVGVTLIFLDISKTLGVEVLATGALLLSLAAILSYLSWKDELLLIVKRQDRADENTQKADIAAQRHGDKKH